MIFSPFGDVKKAVLIKDYVTGLHKSYGFVEYTTVKAMVRKFIMKNFDHQFLNELFSNRFVSSCRRYRVDEHV